MITDEMVRLATIAMHETPYNKTTYPIHNSGFSILARAALEAVGQ